MIKSQLEQNIEQQLFLLSQTKNNDKKGDFFERKWLNMWKIATISIFQYHLSPALIDIPKWLAC